MPPFIQVRDLSHIYVLEDGPPVAALDHVDLEIDHGEFVALIGANASGKSTLAQHLNALLLPTSGEVLVDGLSTRDRGSHWEIRRRVGMVFQSPDNQIVASTVEEDIAFGPENWGLPPDQIRQRVDEALHVVGLEEYGHTPPEMLSGGQKQLVAIAGALATRPDCLVLDEPTSMLDPMGRGRVMGTIHGLNAERDLAIVLITHSMSEAASAQRVLVMHQGKIAIDGAPDTVFRQVRRLTSLGLSVPPAAEIAQILREKGMPLTTHPLSMDALAEALPRWCSGAQAPCS